MSQTFELPLETIQENENDDLVHMRENVQLLPPASAQESLVGDHLTTPCGKHQREIIKFYCHDHKRLLCSVCVTLEHTSTKCKLNYIPDISAQMTNNKEYENIQKAMNSLIDKCNKFSEDIAHITEKSNCSLMSALAETRKFLDKTNQRKDELKMMSDNEVNDIKEENERKLKTVRTTCDKVTKNLMESFNTIRSLNPSTQTDNLFIELKSAEELIREIERKILQLRNCNMKEYRFTSNKWATDIQESVNPFVLLTCATLIPSPTIDIKFREATYHGRICVKTSKDIIRCCIRGMTAVGSDRLVVTDWNNYALKFVDTCNQCITDELNLDTWPHDVTKVSNTKLAVTLPYKHSIQFIQATSNKLIKKQTLTVDGKCYGISYYQGNIVVTFKTLQKIQILDIKGTVLQNVSRQDIFKTPAYVSTNGSGIYVTDFTTQTVARLDWNGNVIATFGDIHEPQGIALLEDETVYVCDGDRSVIKEITSDCSAGNDKLSGLKNPRAICCHADQRLLYYSNYSRDANHDQYIQIYQL